MDTEALKPVEMASVEAVGYMIIAAKYYGVGTNKIFELKILMETFMELCTKEQAESAYHDFQKILENMEGAK